MLKGKTPLTICFLLAAVFSTGLSYAQMTPNQRRLQRHQRRRPAGLARQGHRDI